MIEIYEGRLGGGKTYSAVVRIVDHLRQGGVVSTNVELNWEAIVDYAKRFYRVILQESQLIKLEDDQIGEFHKHTPSGTDKLAVLVVLDEAHLNFNSRDWSTTSKQTLAFLTQSRKVHTDIIFISQSALNIDKQFMRLVQYIWRFRDLSKWKIPGLGIGYPFQQILSCQYDYDGKTMLQKTFQFKNKEIFKLYKTNSIVRGFPRLEGVETSRTLETIKRRINMKYIIIIGLVIGIFAAFKLKDQIKNIGKPKTAKKTEQTTPEVKPKIEAPKIGAYEMHTEKFVSWIEETGELITDKGKYKKGEMSERGFVLGISATGVVKVQQSDGRTAWIIPKGKS
jgi:zona occludens toxin (predicted ATPase)